MSSFYLIVYIINIIVNVVNIARFRHNKEGLTGNSIVERIDSLSRVSGFEIEHRSTIHNLYSFAFYPFICFLFISLVRLVFSITLLLGL